MGIKVQLLFAALIGTLTSCGGFLNLENKSAIRYARQDMSRIFVASEGEVNKILTNLLEELEMVPAQDAKEAVEGELNLKEIDKRKTKRVKKKRTKTQIKTLKFLMMQDVEKLIQNKDPSAAEKAQKSIKQLQTLYENEKDPSYKPTTLNYNILLKALAKSDRDDAPLLAEKILNQMKQLYEKTCDEEIRPDVITYTEVIDAYARSNDKKAADKAEEILLQMMKQAEDSNDVDGKGSLAPSSITCDAGK